MGSEPRWPEHARSKELDEVKEGKRAVGWCTGNTMGR
jgi:hypothetical protein